VVHIRRRFSAHGNTVRATKNHRRRTLELPTLLRTPLERLIREAGDPPSLPDLADRELDARPFLKHWLIQTSTGRPPSLTAFNRALADACCTVGAPHVSSQGLRHTYVSWMIDRRGAQRREGRVLDRRHPQHRPPGVLAHARGIEHPSGSRD
jgi:integrase